MRSVFSSRARQRAEEEPRTGGARELLDAAHFYKAELLARMKVDLGALETGSLVGVGFGAKSTGGVIADGQNAVRVYVRTKVPLRQLPLVEAVPAEIHGLPTDVIAVGDLRVQARPTLCGVSIGHPAITAGTLGCLVRRGELRDEAVYILSNNHVLANCNEASEGDPILEPGPLDGGDPSDPIATLADFEPLRFGGPVNQFDAAIARVLNPADVDPRIISMGAVGALVLEPVLYQSVRKQGRTTLHTLGAILDVSADIRVRYDMRFALFEDQIAVSGVGGLFSDSGDSGALIVEALTLSPIALLLAGGVDISFGSPIQPILNRFGLEIL